MVKSPQYKKKKPMEISTYRTYTLWDLQIPQEQSVKQPNTATHDRALRGFTVYIKHQEFVVVVAVFQYWEG